MAGASGGSVVICCGCGWADGKGRSSLPGTSPSAHSGHAPAALLAQEAQTRWKQPATASSGRTARQHGHTSGGASSASESLRNAPASEAPAAELPGLGVGVLKPPSSPWTGSPHDGHTLSPARMQLKQHACPQRSSRLVRAPHDTQVVDMACHSPRCERVCGQQHGSTDRPKAGGSTRSLALPPTVSVTS